MSPKPLVLGACRDRRSMNSGTKAVARRLGGIRGTLSRPSALLFSGRPAAQASAPGPAPSPPTRPGWSTGSTPSGPRTVAATLVGWCPQVFADHWAIHLARTGTFYHQSMYPILGCQGQP